MKRFVIKGNICYDYSDKLIIPGFADLHVHAPQYSFRGLGMDLELLDWLNTHTFVEEAKYQEPDYAEKAYDIFAEDTEAWIQKAERLPYLKNSS